MKKSIFYVCVAGLLLAAASCGDNRINNTNSRTDTTTIMDNTPVYPADPYDRPLNADDTAMRNGDTERMGYPNR